MTITIPSLCPHLLQTRQLVTVCDSKLLSSAILALAAARPEFTQQGTPSPSISSLSPSSHSPSRSPSRPPTSPSHAATSPSRHAAPPEGSEGSKNKRASMQADLHEEEWVREEPMCFLMSVLMGFFVVTPFAVCVFVCRGRFG